MARHAPGSGQLFQAGKVPALATIHRIADRRRHRSKGAEYGRERVDQDSFPGPRPRQPSTAIAVDGKEARGAKNGGGTWVFLMTALDHITGAVIGQESIGEKTNEIPQFGALMDRLGTCPGWW